MCPHSTVVGARSLSGIAVRDEAKEMRPDARPQARKNRRCIRWITLRIFSGRERRRWSQIVRRSRTVNVGQAPRGGHPAVQTTGGIPPHISTIQFNWSLTGQPEVPITRRRFSDEEVMVVHWSSSNDQRRPRIRVTGASRGGRVAREVHRAAV